MRPTTNRQRVEAGAAYLDKKRRSPYWRKRINLEQLELSSCDECMLGQLYGEYDAGLDVLGLEDGDDAEDLGFVAEWLKQYPHLTRTWREYIEETRGNGA